MAPSTPTAVLNQWLWTATKGNVLFEKSLFVDRYSFACKVCQATLTLPGCDFDVMNGTIDYSLQQFVQIHSHVGGHVGYYAQPAGNATYPQKKIETSIDWESYQGMNPLSSTTGKTSYTATYYPPELDQYTAAPTPAPEPTPVTIDFKKVKPKNLKLSTGRKFR